MTWPEAVVASVGIAFGAPSVAFMVTAFWAGVSGRDPWPWRRK